MPIKVSLHDAWNGASNCRSCKLRDSALFAGLQEEDFEIIHAPIAQIELNAGERLYRAGEQGSRLFTLREGLIKLVRYLPDGTQRIVRLIRPSDVVGLEALLESPYEHDALAMQDAMLCALPAETVQQLSQQNPLLHKELLTRWQRALTEANLWITELATGTARQRMARLIIYLSQFHDNQDCELFAREDIGAMLGITTETASRIIAEFKREKWLIERRNNVFSTDISALNSL